MVPDGVSVFSAVSVPDGVSVFFAVAVPDGVSVFSAVSVPDGVSVFFAVVVDDGVSVVFVVIEPCFASLPAGGAPVGGGLLAFFTEALLDVPGAPSRTTFR